MEEEIKKIEKFQELIEDRIEHDIFVPRLLCSFQGQEIEELKTVLHNYKELLMEKKKDVVL